MSAYVGLSILPHNDLEFVDGGLRLVRDAEAIAQHARQRLKSWAREWFLNEDAGVDWMFYVFSRRAEEKAIGDSMIKAVIMATPGVVDLVEFQSAFDRINRGLIVSRAVVMTVFGEIDIAA